MKTLLRLALAGLLLFAAVLMVNTARLPAPASRAPAASPPAVDAEAAAARLAGAIRLPTISHEDPAARDPRPFDALAAYLEAQFPRVHAQLQRERINGQSLLYRWEGRDPAAAPWLLLAHLDVVPVEPGTESTWTQPPFSGAIADGYIWGRGTLDDKASAMAWLEAAEALLAQGHVPPQTVYFAFGHDEEVGGQEGAQAIAALLQARGVQAALVLDEGGAITQGLVAGVDRPVASIMAGEKGYASFRLRVRAEGGHSSMPPLRTAAGRVAAAVARVQEQPMPARITAPVREMLRRLAPELPLAQRVAIANDRLFAPLLLRAFAGAAVTRALTRTSFAPTMLRAGIKDNVLPAEAEAVINVRLLPGDAMADVEAHLRRVIDDPEVELERLAHFSGEASALSPTDTPEFRRLETAVNAVFPEALVSTGLVVGGTDARHYGAVARLRYNFTPVLLRADDLPRIHGRDERIAVDAYANMVRWYAAVLRPAP